MDFSKFGKAIALTASATAIAALTACGSDKQQAAAGSSTASSAGGSSVRECGGKNALRPRRARRPAERHRVFNQAWGQKCPGKNLSYNPTGSGAGVNQFIAGQVDFAGSGFGAPRTSRTRPPPLRRKPAWNLPLVFGPVALAYNLPGVDKLAPERRRAGEDLHGRDHHLE